jgi:hypothetical protein
MMIKLSLHLLCSYNFTETGNVVLLVIYSPALILAGLSYWTWRPGAIFTKIDGCAHSTVEIVSGVLLA